MLKIDSVLSLFDGISGAQVALRNLGVIPNKYYASEINKSAITVTQANFPDTIQLGDITKIKGNEFSGSIDLVCGGFPCLDMSIGKKNRQSLKGDSSSLFYDAVRLLKEIKPKYFLIENVASMKNDAKREISDILETNAISINSNLFLPQNRARYYWTNWQVKQPEKQHSREFKDILLPYEEIKHLELSEKAKNYMSKTVNRGKSKGDRYAAHAHKSDRPNSNCLVANMKKGVPYTVIIDKRFEPELIRHLHSIEAERLQGFPDNFTKNISKTSRFECIGNSFTTNVISYLLNQIPN